MTPRSATRSTRPTTASASCGSNARTDSRSHRRHDHQDVLTPSGDTPGPARSRNVGQIHLRYFAGALRAQEGSLSEIDENTIAYHFHVPLGVVGQIIPWNF